MTHFERRHTDLIWKFLQKFLTHSKVEDALRAGSKTEAVSTLKPTKIANPSTLHRGHDVMWLPFAFLSRTGDVRCAYALRYLPHGCFTPPLGSILTNKEDVPKEASPLSDVEVKMYLLRMYSAEVTRLRDGSSDVSDVGC